MCFETCSLTTAYSGAFFIQILIPFAVLRQEPPDSLIFGSLRQSTGPAMYPGRASFWLTKFITTVKNLGRSSSAGGRSILKRRLGDIWERSGRNIECGLVWILEFIATRPSLKGLKTSNAKIFIPTNWTIN